MYIKQGYSCIELNCQNKTSRPDKRCVSCKNKGSLNPSWKDNALIRQKFNCKKCGNSITYQGAIYGSGLCRSCSNSKTRIGKIPWNKGILNSTGNYWLGKSNKNIIINHHLDGNKKNDNLNNFLKIKQGLHRSLHWRGYEYLVEIGLVDDYLREFIIKYDINTLIGDGKVLHHIDCNRENNNQKNFLYVSSKSLHNKLHQEAYLYLAKINKVQEYLKWFMNRLNLSEREYIYSLNRMQNS